MTKRITDMPEANKMARSLRSGASVDDLALRYDVEPHLIARKLKSSGWDPATGLRTAEVHRRIPLTDRGAGAGQTCHHVGGGDNPNVVPTRPRPFTPRVRKSTITWPEPTPINTGALLRQLRAADPKPVPPPQAKKHRGGRPPLLTSKLSLADQDELVRRYVEDGEGSTTLAREYGIPDRSVRKFLRRRGIEVRDARTAGRVRAIRNGNTPDDRDDGPEAA